MENLLIGAILTLTYSVSLSESGCSPPPPILGGRFEPDLEDYKYGEMIYYYCENGYQRAAGSVTTKTCQGLPAINAYVWSRGAIGCTPVDCGEPSFPNAQFDSPLNTKYQDVIEYKCADGFAPMGTLQARCSVNATWDYTPCREAEFYCPKPPDVPHTKVNGSQSRQQHGTTIQYRCKSGYVQQGTGGSLYCRQTTWVGKLPTCAKVTPVVLESPTQNPGDSVPRPGLSEHALPIVAGVVTAVLLTAILIVTVLCLRKKYKMSSESRDIPESGSNTVPQSLTVSQQPPQLVSSQIVKHPTVCQTMSSTATGLTLPYHSIQCPHHNYTKSEQNYVPDSSLLHYKPLVTSSEHTHSSSPSTVQSEVSATDSDLNAMRECFRDFGNNNLPANHPPPHNLLPPHIHSYPSQHFHTLTAHQHGNSVFHSATAPRTRTLWTADGRPYEAVTCSHGVEHVYQPLEHIYEEPHTWTRPLPNMHCSK